MTKLQRLEIALVNPQVVYFPGQSIQGQVIVELTDRMKMRGRNVNNFIFYRLVAGRTAVNMK